MKKPIISIIIVLLFAISIFCFEPITSQAQSTVGTVTINYDGSITPETASIQQIGNMYKLTESIKTKITLKIDKSDTIFDGNGFTIGNGDFGRIVIESAKNVTVKNFIISTGWTDCMVVHNSSNILIENNTLIGGQDQFGQKNGVALIDCSSVKINGNKIQDSMCGIYLRGSKDNIITRNIVQAKSSWTWGNYPAAIMIDLRYMEEIVYASGSSNNLIYNNVFMSNGNLTAINGTPNNSWDNGKIGNYWGDYLTKYPNAVEVGISGIGDTAYVINANNIDHYPLMSPVFEFETTPTPSSSPAPTPTPSVPELSWLVIVPLLFLVFSIAVVFRRRQKIG